MELIVLVIIFDDGTGQRLAFGDAETRRERSCRHVAHHDFQGDDLHLLDQLLAHVEAPHEMRRHSDRIQLRHQIFGDPVVEHALAFQHGALLGVEGGGVVLEILDQRARLGSLIEDLGLALVDRSAPFHEKSLSFAFAALDCIALFGRQAGPRDARRVEMATGPFAEDDGPVMGELSEARPLGQRARGRRLNLLLRCRTRRYLWLLSLPGTRRFAKYHKIIRGLDNARTVRQAGEELRGEMGP